MRPINVDDFLVMAATSFMEGVLSIWLKKRFKLSLEIFAANQVSQAEAHPHMTRSFSWRCILHTLRNSGSLTSEPLSGEFVQHTFRICQTSSLNHKHDQGFGNLHVLSYSGLLRHLASFLTHCDHRVLQRQRWGIIPPNQAVSVHQRDVLEKLFGVLIKSNTGVDCILKR